MKTRDLLQLLVLSAVWGVSFLLIRMAGDSFPPLWVALLRCSAGSLLLWTVMLFGRRSLPPRRLLPWLLAVALFNNAIPFTFFAWGERTIPSSTAAVVNATTPIWTLLISMAVQRGHVTGRMMAGVMLSFAGVVLVVMGHAERESLVQRQGLALGVSLVVMASLGYAIATVMAKMQLRGLDPIGLATTQLTLASLMLLPMALATQHPVRSQISLGSAGAIAALGFAGSGIAYLLYYNLLAHASATHVVAVTYLLPIWGIFWGLVAKESIGWTAYVGVAVVVLGLVMLNWKMKTSAGVQAGGAGLKA